MRDDSLGFQEFLRTRRSVRRFLPRPVSEKLIEQIIEIATWAPSAHNRQPWRFVVLMDLQDRLRIGKAMAVEYRRTLLAEGVIEEQAETQAQRSRKRLSEAPVAVLFCLDTDALDKYQDEKRSKGEVLMGVQGVAMAGCYLLLAAHTKGLGGVWTCAPLFVPEIVQRELDLPKSWQSQGMILLGYPAENPIAKVRRPVAEVVRFI